MSDYATRFAPTPSGRLHLGSTVALIGSYLRAKEQGGAFLIRIEDLDFERCHKEHTESILKEIAALSIAPDAPVLIQSQNLPVYEQALQKIKELPEVYCCQCTRAQLKKRPCPCFGQNLTEGAVKIKLELDDTFEDAMHGTVRGERPTELLTLKRRDGMIAYSFACVIDDLKQKVTEVVRGADLIDATFAQNALYKTLGFKSPSYLHLPLAVCGAGKLSKQNHAAPVFDLLRPPLVICASLKILGLPYEDYLKESLKQASDETGLCREILKSAVSMFKAENLRRESFDISGDFWSEFGANVSNESFNHEIKGPGK